MKSPIRARGSLTVAAAHDGAGARVMAFQLSRSLNSLLACEIDVGEESVSFKAALLRVVWGWNLLKPRDRCVVKLKTVGESVIVDYELRLVEAPALALGIALIIATPLFFVGDKATAIAALLVFSGLFGGMHHLLIQWRFQRFLGRTLRRANRRTMPPP